jgi:hypothetical protein
MHDSQDDLDLGLDLDTGRPPRRRLLGRTLLSAAVLALVAPLLVSGGLAIVADDPPVVLGRGPDGPPAGDPFAGVGAWVDVFDYLPSYQAEGQPPSVQPEDVAAMAAEGVETLYLQTSGTPARHAGALGDRDLIAEFVSVAHEHGLAVVAWYAPQFARPEEDLARLLAAARFEPAGGFDALAVDIELTETEPDVAVRNERLLWLSRELRDAVGERPLGAIVLPPLLLSDVNPGLWPDFPWAGLTAYYDTWLPMAYWTFRTADSGLRDPDAYVRRNVDAVRELVGDADAPVHVIGGVGDAVDEGELATFTRTLRGLEVSGASIYDFATSPPGLHADLGAALDGDGSLRP